MSRWRVQKRYGKWQIIAPDDTWHDGAESLEEAVEDATRYAIFDELNKPNGLLCYFGMRRLAERTAMDGWLLQGFYGSYPSSHAAYREAYGTSGTYREHFA